MFKFLLVACLMFSQVSYADEADIFKEEVLSGNLSPEAADFLMESIESIDGGGFETYEDFERYIIAEAHLCGISLEGENKNLVKTALRIAWQAVKSGAAHAATHDGRGRCNSGCGRNRGGRSSP